MFLHVYNCTIWPYLCIKFLNLILWLVYSFYFNWHLNYLMAHLFYYFRAGIPKWVFLFHSYTLLNKFKSKYEMPLLWVSELYSVAYSISDAISEKSLSHLSPIICFKANDLFKTAVVWAVIVFAWYSTFYS